MSVSVGARFGGYEILALLGSGGMGEVYRARDTRLDRTAVVKSLGRSESDYSRLVGWWRPIVAGGFAGSRQRRLAHSGR